MSLLCAILLLLAARGNNRPPRQEWDGVARCLDQACKVEGGVRIHGCYNHGTLTNTNKFTVRVKMAGILDGHERNTQWISFPPLNPEQTIKQPVQDNSYFYAYHIYDLQGIEVGYGRAFSSEAA